MKTHFSCTTLQQVSPCKVLAPETAALVAPDPENRNVYMRFHVSFALKVNTKYGYYFCMILEIFNNYFTMLLETEKPIDLFHCL